MYTDREQITAKTVKNAGFAACKKGDILNKYHNFIQILAKAAKPSIIKA